jgi:hypothetical protein
MKMKMKCDFISDEKKNKHIPIYVYIVRASARGNFKPDPYPLNIYIFKKGEFLTMKIRSPPAPNLPLN